ncbi:endo-1,4-beta-xylanase [Arthrobacter sedimenti]|uniref:endo-1,4-beta-xylanase n=1 Tax=Arthrobacter sedimenti TaxID=2694931 RepID=UPI0022775879|nr:endo-1,4-beta-xylanase [Arthrobacter sedimenti]
MLREHNESVDSVTFWGISNARTWLRTWPMARPWEQPLPFDDELQVTPAYWGIVDPSRLPAGPPMCCRRGSRTSRTSRRSPTGPAAPRWPTSCRRPSTRSTAWCHWPAYPCRAAASRSVSPRSPARHG